MLRAAALRLRVASRPICETNASVKLLGSEAVDRPLRIPSANRPDASPKGLCATSGVRRSVKRVSRVAKSSPGPQQDSQIPMLISFSATSFMTAARRG
jgi:hypothetical protein